MAEAPNARATVLATRHRSLQQAKPKEKIKTSSLITLGVFLLATFRPTMDPWLLDVLVDIIAKGYFLLNLANTLLFMWKSRQLAVCKRELRQFPLTQLALLGIRKEDIYPPGVEPPPAPVPIRSDQSRSPVSSNHMGSAPTTPSRFLSMSAARQRSPMSPARTCILDPAPASPGPTVLGASYSPAPSARSAQPFAPVYSQQFSTAAPAPFPASPSPYTYAAGTDFFASGPPAHTPLRYHPSPPQNPRPASDRRIVPSNQVWSRLMRVADRDVRQASIDCQKWVIKTILTPLLNEIESLNQQLAQQQSMLRLGISSLTELDRARETVRAPELLSRIARVRPYLALHHDQEFLLRRLRGLASIHPASETIAPSLPSDTQILVHMFCCFCDMTLYPGAHLGDARFTALHFLGQTEVPTATISMKRMQSDFYIFLTNSVPMAAQVLLVRDGEEFILALPHGQNNAYEVILLAMCNARDRHGGRMDEEDTQGLASIGALSLPPLSSSEATLVSDFKKIL